MQTETTHRAATALWLYDQGNRLAVAGEAGAAAAAYGQALADRPDFAEAYNNLGNVQRALGWPEAALASYRRALWLGLGHPLVHYNLGSVLKGLGLGEEAAAAFRRALALDPLHAEAHNNYANLLRGEGRHAEAVAGYRRALALRPDWDEAHDNLAGALYLLHEAGRKEETVRLAALWRRDHPDHPVARHIGAALAGASGEPRASDAYVRQVFDHFAEDFEATLASLGYRAPALLGAAVAEALPAAAALDVLDAGCGTGLCAPLLRPFAKRLVGVDLSPGMLALAGARGLYDWLREEELGSFLAGHPASFDLIVAADVLCYFGVLDEVLSRAVAALVPGGLLAFTVERLEAGRGDHRMQPHGRYAHGESYVAEVVRKAGGSTLRVAREVLREESGEPVPGLLVVARRP